MLLHGSGPDSVILNDPKAQESTLNAKNLVRPTLCTNQYLLYWRFADAGALGQTKEASDKYFSPTAQVFWTHHDSDPPIGISGSCRSKQKAKHSYVWHFQAECSSLVPWLITKHLFPRSPSSPHLPTKPPSFPMPKTCSFCWRRAPYWKFKTTRH
jgi:hypothetical protein